MAIEESTYAAAAGARVAELETELTEARRRAAMAFQSLHGFKDLVRERVIEKIKDNTICLSGSNEWLEGVGLDPYIPRWRVVMNTTIVVEVESDDESDAADLAIQSVSIKGDEDVLWIDTGDFHVESVEDAANE